MQATYTKHSHGLEFLFTFYSSSKCCGSFTSVFDTVQLLAETLDNLHLLQLAPPIGKAKAVH